VLSRTPEGRWLGLYYDTLAACTFDLGCEHDNYHGLYRHVEIDDGDLDLYLMAGTAPGEVIAQFVRLIGGTALPPRWALGYAQTAMGLADAPDAQARLHAFIDEIRAHRMPVSAFHYGSGYSMRGPRRYVYTWNRDKFPEPQALNARFHQAGLHVVANIKPCLLDDHPAFETLARDGGFVVDGQGRPVVEPYWDGQAAFLDFTHPAGLRWWQEGLRRQILDMGIDAGWNDNNEHAVQDEAAQSHGFGAPMPIHRSRPLHALLMTRATWEAQRERAAPGEPVYTVTRAGPPGIQRYAQTWSGDNTTNWRTLKWNLRTGLQMSLSGMFNVGHDVGGFYGPVPEPELFARWVQACCLNPRMVMNSWKAGNVVNLPWMHPEVADIVRAAIELRYRLLPTLWQLFERAAAQHEPIIRPTFFDFPGDAQCLEDSDDFMLGPDLLVAPVVEPGQRERRVWLPALPAGASWFDFETREAYPSGAWHTVSAPLDKLPLFARAGARIPVAAPAPGALATVDDGVREVVTF
jgi:alpha-glucosidase